MLRKRLSSITGPIGVEFSRDRARLLQLREHSDGLAVVGAAEVELAADDLEAGGDIGRLRDQVRHGGFHGRRCVVSIPPDCVHVQSVRLPAMSEPDLQAAARWEAAQRFELDREASEVAVLRTGGTTQGTEGREELLLVAASHDDLMPRLQLLLDAGLQPVAVETQFSALARTFSRQCRRAADRDQVRGVLDIGEDRSTALVLRGAEIAFCKPIAIGLDDMAARTAERLQVDIEAARGLRERRFAAGWAECDGQLDPAADRAVFEAVRPQLEELSREFVLCLRYYGVTFRGRPPSCVYLAGPGACEPQLADMLAHACKTPVRIDDTVGTLRGIADAVERRCPGAGTTGFRWATAAGLSMRGFLAGRKAGLAA